MSELRSVLYFAHAYNFIPVPFIFSGCSKRQENVTRSEEMAALVLTALSISPVLKDADQSKGQKLFQNYAIHGVFVFSLIQHARSSFAIYLPVNTRGALRMR